MGVRTVEYGRLAWTVNKPSDLGFHHFAELERSTTTTGDRRRADKEKQRNPSSTPSPLVRSAPLQIPTKRKKIIRNRTSKPSFADDRVVGTPLHHFAELGRSTTTTGDRRRADKRRNTLAPAASRLIPSTARPLCLCASANPSSKLATSQQGNWV